MSRYSRLWNQHVQPLNISNYVQNRFLRFQRQAGDYPRGLQRPPRRQGPGNGRHPHPGGDPHDPQGTRRGRLGNPDVASGTAQEEQRYEIFARTDRPRDRKAAGQTRDFRRRLHGRKSGRNSPEPQTRRGDAARKPAFLRRGGGQAPRPGRRRLEGGEGRRQEGPERGSAEGVRQETRFAGRLLYQRRVRHGPPQARFDLPDRQTVPQRQDVRLPDGERSESRRQGVE